ncbi:Sec-independent protein translocase protein TatB [Psychrobacter alimentarius]|uniref:Sec-independent protein translocase protein TatB n=1 Tax=Psychrobacter alimentarius TaxID=261164 RepID=UPI001919372A|nr:Sec-independent protein translocase protein TatB [Psychrobacter alimentarius]
MFDIGFSELLLFGVIALIVLGPEKLPQAARTAGQWYAKIRRTIATLQSEIEAELDLAETRQQMQKELAKIRQTEADMRREMAEMRGNMQEFAHSHNQHLKTSQTTTDVIDNSQSDKTEHENIAVQSTEDVSDTATTAQTHQSLQPIITKPWENMWFRLGAYDKARRLPMPPYLPNYKADVLLNAHPDPSLAQPAFIKKQEAD